MKGMLLMKNDKCLRAATTRNYLLPALLFLMLTACVTAQKPPAAPLDPALLEALFAQGIELQDKGDARGAIKVFDELLALDPRHVPALSEKSYALMVLHRYRPVLDLTTEVLRDHAGSDQARAALPGRRAVERSAARPGGLGGPLHVPAADAGTGGRGPVRLSVVDHRRPRNGSARIRSGRLVVPADHGDPVAPGGAGGHR
ncbi:MAG: hypothetical protein EOP50_19600, partial [Sphingobacteriales bacterium]